jgi:hypothetical protein
MGNRRHRAQAAQFGSDADPDRNYCEDRNCDCYGGADSGADYYTAASDCYRNRDSGGSNPDGNRNCDCHCDSICDHICRVEQHHLHDDDGTCGGSNR